MNGHSFTARLALVVFTALGVGGPIAVALMGALLVPATVFAKDVAPPDEPGPFKALVLYEPAPHPLSDASTINVPYLIMGGLQNRNGVAIPALFEATVSALPRIYVVSPRATHFNFLTGTGAEIDQTREAALLADPTLPEPLTTRIATNAAAARRKNCGIRAKSSFRFLGSALVVAATFATVLA